ncbi:hypothetical protein [Mesorhizobium sp. ANAO-SY3R2]|uniref:hypothetical protein n=1 Tax=Mesorhizobium sp. ANAO-SY3R2 TaxID=3166644 RepID=UPI00366CE24F
MSEEATNTVDDGFEWAIVEIFGHRRHAGRIREEERFGAKMLRIDVPTVAVVTEAEPASIKRAVEGWTTHWYGGSSIFSLTLTDEATVLKINSPYASAARYLPSPTDDEED